MDKKIKKIIAKYFDGQLSAEEADKLVKWVEEGNIDAFNEYVMVNYAINEIEGMRQGPNTDLWNRIAKKIEGRNKGNSSSKTLRIQPWKYAAAAAVAILISTSILYFNRENRGKIEPQNILVKDSHIAPGTDKAVLTLEDGTEVALENGTDYSLGNFSSNGREITYSKNEEKAFDEIVYNYLTVPRGGQFFVELSDGTKVWLNSETRLKYPVDFVEGETRMVELLYGEAFFDVSSSTENQGAMFKVLQQDQEIEVLGTQFNIKAYQDEAIISTTLVEGRIALKTNEKREVLAPTQQSVLNKESKEITISEVDVRSQISWKDGLYIFKNKSLKTIMATLSRWYDINVVFDDKELEEVRFNGALYKEQSFSDVLNEIKNFGIINGYEIDNKTITLKK